MALTRSTFIAVAAAFVLVVHAASAAVSYWDFNVFSRSTIGSQGQGYGANFQGASGALEDAYFSNFSAKSAPGSSPKLSYGFYGGGSLSISSGSVANNGVHVAGDILLTNASLYGSVVGGGNVSGSGGTIYGDVTAFGTVQAGISITGTVATDQKYEPLLDVADVAAYFQNFGASAAAMSPTSTYANNWGELVINSVGPITVVNVAMSDFASAWGVRVVGNGAVVLNVAGTSASFGSKTWTYQNGASNASTLLNLNQATTLTISGGHNVNILAANAATQFSSGSVTGNLIVGSLSGAGAVNWNSEGGFSGAEYVPAPGGLAIFAFAAVLVAQRRRMPSVSLRP